MYQLHVSSREYWLNRNHIHDYRQYRVYELELPIVNPRRTCTEWVTVVILCVCVCVCVCLSVTRLAATYMYFISSLKSKCH